VEWCGGVEIKNLAMQLTLVIFGSIVAVCKSIRKQLLRSENALLRSKRVRTTLQRYAGRTGSFVRNAIKSGRGKCGEASTGAETAITRRPSRRALCSKILTSRYDFGLRLCGMSPIKSREGVPWAYRECSD